MSQPERLLDGPPVTAADYAAIEDRCREVLATDQTMFIFQGEATVALEAAARGLGRPGWRALNVVSGPYGTMFGNWISEGGAQVESVMAPEGRAIRIEQIEKAFDRSGPVDVICVVHAEAATGVVNDLPAIARIARSHEALVVVDAVASVGAEPLAIDAWGLDLVVLGAQKALAGPAGVSMVVASPAAWGALAGHPSPRRGSVLSLLDWRDHWVGTDRSSLPVLPSHLEMRALDAAIERVAKEGLGRVVARHRAATAATHGALPPLGLQPWARRSSEAASVATLVCAPAEGALALATAATASAAWAGSGDLVAPIGTAPLDLAEKALRVNHTGRLASLTAVYGAVTALARGMKALGYDPDLGAALVKAADAWDKARAGPDGDQ